MHMLEMHVVPWLKRWGVGLEIMGEQGAESIHAAINNITPAYLNIPDKVKRLKKSTTDKFVLCCRDLYL